MTDDSHSYLETIKKMIELLRCEVPRQLGQQVMNVLDNGLMFTSLHRHTSKMHLLGY